MVRLVGLTIRRGGRQILGPLTADLPLQGRTMVLGPNGSGKTTLLRALHGLVWPSAGGIHWPGEQPPAQAMIFQSPILLRRDVLANIAYPLLLRGVAASAAMAEARHWAAQMGLSALGRQPAHLLSGGEKQKLALARALITGPQLLLLDEPCANLDNRAIAEFEALLTGLDIPVIMATHDLHQARRLADRALLLDHGALIEQAPREVFFDHPSTASLRAFLNGELLP